MKEFSKRYFYSHGPATIKDFVWWSGLTVKDAKMGLKSLKSELNRYDIGNNIYWSKWGPLNREWIDGPSVKILPQYDDYLLGYQDRGASIDETTKKLLQPKYGRFNQVIIVNGRVTGTWKREIKENKVFFKLNHFRPLNGKENRALISEINDYSKFIDKKCAGIKSNF